MSRQWGCICNGKAHKTYEFGVKESIASTSKGNWKDDHRLSRNRLGRRLGDAFNVIFAAAGFNLRKLMRAYALYVRWRMVRLEEECRASISRGHKKAPLV